MTIHFATIIDLCLPFDMAHFLSCYKKSLLTKQWLSSLVIVLDFMVYHTLLCFIDTLPCWQIWQSLTRKLNTKLIMSAARHPHIDGLERVDETIQISLRCYSSRLDFWLGISYTHGWFLLHVFNQWDFDTFKVPYVYLPADYLIDYGQWLMHWLSLLATCLTWQVFGILFESY
jgi:hypothetical protein